jgi:hypothetical protein
MPGCANILGLEDRTLLDGGSGSSSTSSSASTSSSSAGLDGSLADVVDPDGPGNDGSLPGDGSVPDVVIAEASTTCPGTGNCVIATGLGQPWLIAADDTRVYWTEGGTSPTSGDGAVKSCPITGCSGGPTVYATAVNFPRVLVIDSTNVYWGTNDSTLVNGGIWWCPLAGCGASGPNMLAAASKPYGMALDATYVYWVDQVDFTVHRMVKTGGTDQVLDDGTSGVHTKPVFMTVDSSSVYFTDDSGGVFALPLGGGPARTIITNDPGLFEYPVIVDSTYVYYGANNVAATASSVDDFVYRASKTAANPTQTAIVSQLNWAYSIALDSSRGVLYFGDFGTTQGNDGKVGKVNTDGSGLSYYAQGSAPVEWVAFNSTYFFWATFAQIDANGDYLPSTGTIVRSAK